MSTSQTSRIVGMTTHTHTGYAEGRLIASSASRISDSVANNKVVYYFHVKHIRNFAPDGHDTKFSCVGGGVRV